MPADGEGQTAPLLSLSIPFYNEQDNAVRVVGNLVEALEASGITHELMLVNNGSTDETAARLAECALRWPWCRVVTVPVNQGFGWGIIQGLQQARGVFLGFVGGDGQAKPEEPSRLLQALFSADALAGKVARIRRADGMLRRINSWLYNTLTCLLFGTETRDINAIPKIARREVFEAMELSSKDWFIDAEFMLKARWLNLRVLELPTEYVARLGGRSKVRLSSLWEFLRNLAAVRWGGRFTDWRLQHREWHFGSLTVEKREHVRQPA